MSYSRMINKKSLSLFCVFIYIITASVGAFIGGLWAALGISLAIILFISVAAIDRKIPWPSPPCAWLALATLICFAAELPLSSNIDISIKTWLQLVSIFLPLLVLTSPHVQIVVDKKIFVSSVALAAGVGAIALGIELSSGGFLLHTLKNPSASLTEYNRGIAHLVILAFPLFAGLWIEGRKYAALFLVLVLLFPSGLTESHTAKLALILGGSCTLLAFYRPSWVRHGLALMALILSGWPFYAQCFFSAAHDSSVEHLRYMHPSWWHRLEIWDYLSYRILDRPFMGWGLGTTHTLDYLQPHGYDYLILNTPAPHAHNFITELWVETGLPGLGLGIAFLLLSLRGAYALHPSLRPFALGGWAAAVTVSMFGFDFWTDALWAAFALTVFAFGILQQSIQRPSYHTHF